jgi:hypothetical protein
MVDHRNLANADLARLLGQLAGLGVGLIITGHMFVDRRGQYDDDQTAIDTDEAVGPLTAVVAAVHRHGGKIFAQLSHAGSQSVAVGNRPIAPSAVPNVMTGREVPAATSGEIEAVVEAFGAAAGRAVAAGFDGVHLHGANGYLISQFCSPLTNRREDRWGGSPERRDRFVIEVTRRVRAELPPTHALSIKLGLIDIMEGGLGFDESIPRARLVCAAGADALEVSLNVMSSYADNIVPYVAVTIVGPWQICCHSACCARRRRKPTTARSHGRCARRFRFRSCSAAASAPWRPWQTSSPAAMRTSSRSPDRSSANPAWSAASSTGYAGPLTARPATCASCTRVTIRSSAGGCHEANSRGTHSSASPGDSAGASGPA